MKAVIDERQDHPRHGDAVVRLDVLGQVLRQHGNPGAGLGDGAQGGGEVLAAPEQLLVGRSAPVADHGGPVGRSGRREPHDVADEHARTPYLLRAEPGFVNLMLP
jgi:hypothetical protein